MGLFLALILILLIFSSAYPFGEPRYGYGPPGFLTFILLIIIILMFSGRIRYW